MGISSNGIAILMSFLAGAATAVGGLLGLLLAKKIKPVPFAGALGFAGGVMVFVSFVEIYFEGQSYLTKGFIERNIAQPHPDKAAVCVSMTLFFVGWFVASLIDALLHIILDWHTNRLRHEDQTITESVCDQDCCQPTQEPITLYDGGKHSSCLDWKQQERRPPEATSIRPPGGSILETPKYKAPSLWRQIWMSHFFMALTGTEEVDTETQALVDEKFTRECYKITRLGYFTAFVLALHNFPEGIATFTGSAADRRLGLGLCIAIGIHNVPEGMAVAVPILFGTGSKWQAMFYTIISGLAEPIGGFLAWGVIGNEPDPLAFGILFMLTCGIMVNVALKELLFAAIKYDHGNRITSLSFVAGMVVMAVSLISLEYTE